MKTDLRKKGGGDLKKLWDGCVVLSFGFYLKGFVKLRPSVVGFYIETLKVLPEVQPKELFRALDGFFFTNCTNLALVLMQK